MLNKQQQQANYAEADREKNLSQIFQETYPSTYAYALNLCKDRDQVDDIVQEAYLRLLRCNILQLSNPMRYLRSVIYTTVVDQVRREQRRPQTVNAFIGLNEECLPSQFVDHHTPEQFLEDAEQHAFRHAVLVDAMSTLPANARKILTLHFVEDYSAREIATQLQISVNTVKSTITRSKRKLVKKMEKNRSICLDG